MRESQERLELRWDFVEVVLLMRSEAEIMSLRPVLVMWKDLRPDYSSAPKAMMALEHTGVVVESPLGTQNT